MPGMADSNHTNRLARTRELDRALVKQARKIRILSVLSWPRSVGETFLMRWHAGDRALPSPPAIALDHSAQRDALRVLTDQLDVLDPLHAYLDRTARSYIHATDMLDANGTAEFTKRSIALYGAPSDRIHPEAPSHLDAAETFLRIYGERLPKRDPPNIHSVDAAALLQSWVDEAFHDEPLPVQIAPGLTSLATAGSKRVRLRADTTFSRTQLEQLLQHEALVHSATARNGRTQPVLSSMGLGAPRTTCVQEGLATLGEMITDTMDVHRLRRIALRITAIEAGLAGADFIEIFRTFLEGGQTEDEAFHSTHRVFRGGDVRGGSVFTKDVIYLKGMLLTHTFLLKAIQEGHHLVPLRLFAGRMTLGDVLHLAPEFDNQTLVEPTVAPAWVRNATRLSAFLVWTAFTHRIRLDRVELQGLTDYAE